jgi:hypothetical protein
MHGLRRKLVPDALSTPASRIASINSDCSVLFVPRQSIEHYATDLTTDANGEYVYLCPKMAPHKVVRAGREINTK